MYNTDYITLAREISYLLTYTELLNCSLDITVSLEDEDGMRELYTNIHLHKKHTNFI